MSRCETHEVFDTIIRVQHAPNEKILDSIEIITLGGLFPQKMKIGTYEIKKLKEILDNYEWERPFMARKGGWK